MKGRSHTHTQKRLEVERMYLLGCNCAAKVQRDNPVPGSLLLEGIMYWRTPSRRCIFKIPNANRNRRHKSY